jgi:hypothetical protein
VARRRYDVLHEAVTLNAEAERGPVGQAHDAHIRRDIRQREREEMGDVQRRCHSQKVPELVPGAFLHLHETKKYQHSSKANREGSDLEPGRGVRLHNFADVASQLGERGTDMAMFDDKRFGNVIRGGCRGLCSLQVSPIFASASHAM